MKRKELTKTFMMISNLKKKPIGLHVFYKNIQCFNPLKPEFAIVIFIHSKPRIAAAILDLQWIKMT